MGNKTIERCINSSVCTIFKYLPKSLLMSLSNPNIILNFNELQQAFMKCKGIDGFPKP